MSRYTYRDSSSQDSHLPWLSLKRPHCLHLSTTKVRQTLLLRSISSWRHDKHLLRGWGGVTAPQMQHSTWPTPTEGPAIATAKAPSEAAHNVGCMSSSARENNQKTPQHSFNPVAAAAAAAEAAMDAVEAAAARKQLQWRWCHSRCSREKRQITAESSFSPVNCQRTRVGATRASSKVARVYKHGEMARVMRLFHVAAVLIILLLNCNRRKFGKQTSGQHATSRRLF